MNFMHILVVIVNIVGVVVAGTNSCDYVYDGGFRTLLFADALEGGVSVRPISNCSKSPFFETKVTYLFLDYKANRFHQTLKPLNKRQSWLLPQKLFMHSYALPIEISFWNNIQTEHFSCFLRHIHVEEHTDYLLPDDVYFLGIMIETECAELCISYTKFNETHLKNDSYLFPKRRLDGHINQKENEFQFLVALAFLIGFLYSVIIVFFNRKSMYVVE